MQIMKINSYNTNVYKNNNATNFKSTHEREEELRRIAEQKRLEEEQRKKKEEERQRAIEKALERARTALKNIENEDVAARKKAAADKKVIDRIIAKNRAFEHSVNKIKIEVILNAALNGDTKKIADFKSDLDNDIKEYDVRVNARKEAEKRALQELEDANSKKQANQRAASMGNERALAEISWANNKIRTANATLERCKSEKAQYAEDMAEFDALKAAIEEAEAIAVDINKAKADNLTVVNSNNSDESGQETLTEETKASDEKPVAEDIIAKKLYEKRMEILKDVQSDINRYPTIDNEMSTKMARFLLGFICSVQNNTDHNIGEYFGDENTAKELREKLPPECQRRSLEDRAQLQQFDELKDPVMMLIAASRMKKFAPKTGILSQQQQENLLQGIKDMVTMTVQNSDMSNFDDNDRLTIKEILQMIKVSETTDFGISVKLQNLINKLNTKKLNLSFIPPVQVRELESQVQRVIKH